MIAPVIQFAAHRVQFKAKVRALYELHGVRDAKYSWNDDGCLEVETDELVSEHTLNDPNIVEAVVAMAREMVGGPLLDLVDPPELEGA